MNLPILLGLCCVLCLLAGVRLLQHSASQADMERVLQRLSGARATAAGKRRLGRWERLLLRAGMQLPFYAVVALLGGWLVLVLLGLALGGLSAAALALVLPPLLAYLYASVRYRRRIGRMIQQLPALLDHIIRSLKSGRTLGDAMLLAMHNSPAPLHDALVRTRNSVEMGVPLAEATEDFARIYERDEFHILALGVQVNQQYGGNASELLENLISMIRDRDRASRQLRAMTGETRVSAVVLAGMPVALAVYILASNPAFMLGLWESAEGRLLLLCALLLQCLGCLFLWRMLRSI